MKKYILISLAVIILSFTSCVKPEEGGKDNPPAPQEQIVIPSTVDVKPVVSPEGCDTKIPFTAASAWTASVISTKADSWVDVNPKSGNAGPAEIKITTAPNDTYVERNATIQIKCGTQTKDIVLTQKQLDNITVTTDKVELGVEGGSFTIELKSNIDFSYEIDGDWIKYVSTKAYSDKTLTFSAEPNEGVQKREGSVTVKGGEFSETVKVYQSGEEPTLVISQNEYNLAAEGGSIAVEVSSNVAVTMTIPESANWITENQTKSVSTSTFYLDVAVNETKEARSAEITFSNEETGLCETITVYQAGEELTLVISQNEYNLEAEGGSITVEVSSNLAVTMTIPEDILWITENSTKSVSTSTFHLDVAANETKEARSAEITFSNEESGLSEKVTVNQESNTKTPVPEMVDLGLSVKWASFNVGASKPEEYGGYYQWAGLEDVTDMNIYLDLSNCPYHTGSSGHTGWTKYIPSYKSSYWSGTGNPDNKTVLDPEDDVAHVTLGDKWRMPSLTEWIELTDHCVKTQTTLNGVSGWKFTSKKAGYTDNWIFLPTSGYRSGGSINGQGHGYYWSLSNHPDSPTCANGLYSSYVIYASIHSSSGRDLGISVRPVYGDRVSVTGISLRATSLSLKIGETSNLNATITPFNATEKSVLYGSSNTSVAIVDDFGNVMAVNEGSAIITVTTIDGVYTATCSVTVEGANPGVPVPEAVDLGLSVKWASFNVGASKPEDYGGFYQWAGLEDVTDMNISLDFDNCPYHIGSDGKTGWTKYIHSNTPYYWSGSGNPDNKTVLDLEDDVANVKLGGKWRMPTFIEIEELLDGCYEESTTLNGVNVIKFTSKENGKSIYLPAAGYRGHKTLLSAGSRGEYWSSSLNYGYSANGLIFEKSSFTASLERFGGKLVRPVYGDIGDNKVRVTGVSLEPTSISLDVGEKYTLSATVTPSNATDKTVRWTSSDTDIATVDHSGEVTAVKAGNATITVKTTDGGYTATCNVSVKSYEPAVPEMVDLGLSVKWASFNVGASKPEEYGGYYQWAGLEDVTSAFVINFDNCPYHIGSDDKTGWTKYVISYYSSYWSGTGSPDNKTVLDPEDDIAHVTLGGKWRMPTYEEWWDLMDCCTWTWTQLNGVNGYRVTSNKSGYTDKWIFLPAAGIRISPCLYDVGSCGFYLVSNHPGRNVPSETTAAPFDADGVYWFQAVYRYDGMPVRPVYDDPATPVEIPVPDKVFRNYLIQNFDLNNDGAISPYEASKVEVIQIETTDIKSLSGIEYCTELKVLECCGIPKNRAVYPAKLREVDVSKNLKLEYLNLNFNMLESLNVSNNANLKSLSCLESNLSTLDLSHCTRLETFDGDGVKTINISNTKLNDDCRIRGASKIVAKNCKSIQQLFFDVTTSNCTIDTDIPVATFTVYIDINTNINFGSSKVEILLVNGESLGTGYHANLTIKSQNASRVIIDDAPHTLSLCDNDIDLVPKLEKLELLGLPYEVRYSKKDEKDLTIWVCPYQDFRDVYIAQSKLINFGPYVPVTMGYLWKYVKSTPIFVNTYTRSVTNTVYTTGAKETSWIPQQDGYEWYPVSGVDFDFPE